MDIKDLSNNELSKKELNMIHSICENYGFKVLEVHKVRSAYKIVCVDNKCICLKRMRSGKKKIINAYKLTEDLFKNNFFNTPRYIRTTEGNIYITYKKYIFNATQWIDGEECDLDNFDEVLESVQLLAKFHISTKKINTKKYDIRNNLKNWPNIYESCLSDMEKYKNIIQRKKLKTSFDLEYYKHIESFYSRGLEALNILNTSSYYRISKDASKNKPICHDSFYYQNILKKDSMYYLIDLNSIIIDLQINDLGKFIRRIMFKKNYKWDFKKAKDIIDAYSSINPLSKDELYIMLSLIIFPHKFWKLGKKRYIKMKNWTDDKYLKKLQALIKSDEIQKEFYESYLDYLNKI